MEKISVTIILHDVVLNQRAVCKNLAEAEEAFKEFQNVVLNQTAGRSHLEKTKEAFKELCSTPEEFDKILRILENCYGLVNSKPGGTGCLFLIIASEDGQVDFDVYLGLSPYCYHPESLEETIRANIEEFRDAPEPPTWGAVDATEDWAYQWAQLSKVIDRIDFT